MVKLICSPRLSTGGTLAGPESKMALSKTQQHADRASTRRRREIGPCTGALRKLPSGHWQDGVEGS